MKLQPLNDRIVIKPSKAAAKTSGGILLPEAAQEKQSRGDVVAVGPGNLNDRGERIKMDIKVGDHVFYSKYAGTEVKVNDQDFTVLRESDVMAKVN